MRIQRDTQHNTQHDMYTYSSTNGSTMLIQRDTQHNTLRNTRKYFSHLFPPFSPFISFGSEDAPSDYRHNTINDRYHLVLFIPFSFCTPFLDSKTIGDSLVIRRIRSTIHSMIRVQQHDRPYDAHKARYTAQYA